jgi:hypothetical protein
MSPKFTFTPPSSSSISILSISAQLSVNESKPEPTSMSLELDQIPQAQSLSLDHLQSPLASPLMPKPVLVALPTDRSLSTLESLGKHASPLEFASIVDLVLSSPSESSSKLYKIIPLPALLLEFSNTAIPSHSSLQEQAIGVMPHDVTHAVTSTTVLPANTQIVPPSSSFIDHSHAPPSRLSTISSSRFDPQSSHGENVQVPIHPTPPLDPSLTIRPHLSPSHPPAKFTHMDSVSVPFGISAPTLPIVPSISLHR